jgi:hypothetical protein
VAAPSLYSGPSKRKFSDESMIYFDGFLHLKEVIQPHVPVGLPCYDLSPVTVPTLDSSCRLLSCPSLGVNSFHGLTGGVYKARERIHRRVLIGDY